MSVPADDLLPETKSIFQEINCCFEQHAQIALGNLIVKLAQKVFPETVDDANDSRLLTKCQSVTDQQLTNAGIPEKYWSYIKNLHIYNQHLDGVVEDTPVQLANLLSTTTLQRMGISERWADAYRLVYHRSYEEMKGSTLSMYQVL